MLPSKDPKKLHIKEVTSTGIHQSLINGNKSLCYGRRRERKVDERAGEERSGHGVQMWGGRQD